MFWYPETHKLFWPIICVSLEYCQLMTGSFTLINVVTYACHKLIAAIGIYQKNGGGPRGRVVKVADFSALDHSIISPMWVRAPHGAQIHM